MDATRARMLRKKEKRGLGRGKKERELRRNETIKKLRQGGTTRRRYGNNGTRIVAYFLQEARRAAPARLFSLAAYIFFQATGLSASRNTREPRVKRCKAGEKKNTIGRHARRDTAGVKALGLLWYAE